MNQLDPACRSRLYQLALDGQATYATWIDPALIPFAPQLREMCAQNSCGQYDTSWMGPPAIGPVDELMARVRSFADGLVVQSVTQLEDCYDYPGMVEAKTSHQAAFIGILAAVRQEVPDCGLLALDVGCCQICGECTYPDEACRQPDAALASVEAYGINVNAMLTACGLKYNNGRDTVSYVGLILFRTPG
jgi:predicted metal-binding protein